MTLSEPDTATGSGRGRARTAGVVASALASLAFHGSVLAAAFYWIDATPGAIPHPTEAISLALTPSEVTEAIEVSASPLAQASPASVQAEAGADREAPAVEIPDDALSPRAPEAQLAAEDALVPDLADRAPEGIEVLEGALEVAEPTGQDTAERAKPKPAARPARARTKVVATAKEPTPAPPKTSKSAPSRKGGAQSKAAAGSAASSGRVSASTGSALNYAAIVRARVAARRPAGGGRRGTVVVAFGVTRSGALSYARIGRSSGDPGLDRGVLAAVRGAAPFPPPPPGANLRFSVPFYFR